MLRILHVSDLHLGPEANASTGDYKAEVIPLAQRQSRHGLIRHSLEELAGHLKSPLDAIVITGDVSFHGTADGFAEIDSLLSHLGVISPPRDHILVVPGNHDVQWGTPPGSAARYEMFLAHIRDQGFRTPLLEGVDIDATNGTDIGPPHDPILDLGSVMVVGLNSADYCGIDSELQSLTAADLGEIEAFAEAEADSIWARIRLELGSLRRHDVCRVSEGQILAIKRRLAVRDAEGSTAKRVAALHHQLLPVSPSEEVKAFETMVNLGQFREFLSSQDFRLALHGHKHVSKVYLDLVGTGQTVRADLRLERPPILVSSVATVWSAGDVEACRLLEIDDSEISLTSVRIFAVPAVPPGGTFRLPLEEVGSAVCLDYYVAPNVQVFEGGSANEVYAQLRHYFPSESATLVPDVVCRIRDGATALSVPSGYPELPGEDKNQWFSDTIDWWQRPDPRLVFPQFNHGERIHDFRHDRIDQMTNAVLALEKDLNTSRAVVSLFDPREDGSKRPQPAFCLVQFRVAEGKIHCTAYFRKQQMRAWWPINVGEIARLQADACTRLTLDPGEIVTVSAQALGGTDRPRVIVPWVDRVEQAKDNELWNLVLALFVREHPRRGDVRASWEKVFSDWRPTGPREKDGAPVALSGLMVLSRAVSTCQEEFPQAAGSALSEKLAQLFEINLRYWNQDFDARTDDERNTLYTVWAREVARDVDEILAIVDALLAPEA